MSIRQRCALGNPRHKIVSSESAKPTRVSVDCKNETVSFKKPEPRPFSFLNPLSEIRIHP